MLKGTLDDFTLPDIFRLLSQSRKTGRLDVQRSAGQGNVYFQDGDVYFAESTLSKELIGQKLVRAKVLTDGQLMKALDDQAESGGRIGEILRTADLVTEDQLETAVRSQIEDAVFDLLRWDAGEFDWAPGESVDAEVSLSVSVENLIMEGSRRLDEMAIITRKIPSEHAVVEMAPAPPEGAAEINITPNEWRMLVLVNGQRSVLDIAEAVGADVFATMRTLYGLAAAGLVHVPGHVAEDDDDPLPPLPSESTAAEDPAPVIQDLSPDPGGFSGVLEDVAGDEAASEPVSTGALGFEDHVDESTPVDTGPVETAGYHASAYEPEAIPMDDLSSEEEEVPAAEPAALEATDLPTGEWFDAPQPGDLMAETPLETSDEGADADPFVSEILGPETTALDTEPVAEDHAATFESATDHDLVADGAVDASVQHEADDDEHFVDKRAAVQELSDLFKQSEVENTPSFLVPRVELDDLDDEADVVEPVEPESKHRVEDDEDITRGLISRLIDGVKGL